LQNISGRTFFSKTKAERQLRAALKFIGSWKNLSKENNFVKLQEAEINL
jgi:hypothetical protein